MKVSWKLFFCLRWIGVRGGDWCGELGGMCKTEEVEHIKKYLVKAQKN